MLLLRALELPGRGLSISRSTAYLVAGGSVTAGLLWLGIMTVARIRLRRPAPGAGALLLVGLALSYLLVPLFHHLFATPPGYRYITTASNFFAWNPLLQLAAFCVVALMAAGITWGRRRLKTGVNSGD